MKGDKVVDLCKISWNLNLFISVWEANFSFQSIFIGYLISFFAPCLLMDAYNYSSLNSAQNRFERTQNTHYRAVYKLHIKLIQCQVFLCLSWLFHTDGFKRGLCINNISSFQQPHMEQLKHQQMIVPWNSIWLTMPQSPDTERTSSFLYASSLFLDLILLSNQ